MASKALTEILSKLTDEAMFEGDNDRDLVSEFESVVGISMNDDPNKLKEAREKLDAGLGATLMQECRRKETISASFFDPKYTTVVLAAYMMNCGATISDADRAHLQELLPKIPSRSGYALPISDLDFRDPGKVQFQAAFDHYVNGEPRSFLVPSCYHCGKISNDRAQVQLKRCKGCTDNHRIAFYCDRECQKGDWKKHKKTICKPLMPGNSFILMNV